MFKEQFTRTSEEEKFKERQVLVWDSLDGEPVHLIFIIAVTTHQKGNMYLKILQMLSRKLMEDYFRNSL